MSSQAFREHVGGRIDRDQPLSFRFNDRALSGYTGDTLASALLANGVHFVGRSFKYHRPRGILCAGSEEPNALVQVGAGGYSEPNLRATQVELYDGLVAGSQNCWPSLELDVGSVNNALSRFLPAGFYYKTFMWPAGYWMKYEAVIRRAAGLGRAPSQPDPDRYEKMHAHCDVLVVGGGPTGLAAAQSAGRTGARVILVDEQSELGGTLLATKHLIDDESAMRWVESVVEEIRNMDEVRLLPRSTLAGYYDHNYLTIVERVTDHLGPGSVPDRPRLRLWKVRAAQVVLATGAHERPMVFENNDLPGVMLSSAAGTYLNRYAVRPGREAVVFTNNDSAYDVALDLSDAGLGVTVVDVRSGPAPAHREATRKRGIEVLTQHAVVRAGGRRRVSQVEVAPLAASRGGLAGSGRAIQCDLVCMSGGWNPAVHLHSQSGGQVVYDARRACLIPGESVQRQVSAGAASGTFDLAYCLSEGREAGKSTAAAAGFRRRGSAPLPRVDTHEQAPIAAFWVAPPVRPGRRPSKHFVDFQNDVTVADLMLAAREGYRSVEHLKRYTTTGMGTDQGKTGNVNALAILARATGADIGSLGTTTFRPPYTPVTFGVLAGRDVGELADPVRVTAMHRWHVEQGAKLEDVGQWKRPWYYPRPGESMRVAVDRECTTTRGAVGILDASTLGKIDIQGPDAAELLDRVYTNGWKSLAVGRCRYGLMCGEDGMVFDDGVTTRLGERHYLMTTTSGNAARVLAWLEEWLQTEWPHLRVFCNSVTEHWATASISGPLSRKLLGELTSDIDLGPEAFPFMSMREGRVAGIRARVMRISFTGELSYEINVPADYGLALWNALMQTGATFGITPFGTEAMHVLRAEKGFIIAGQDTDGTVTPIDLGMDRMVSKRKDFIGKRSLDRSDTLREDRKHFVGLLTEDPHEVLPEGGQIVERIEPPPMKMIGHVTSSYYSANLGRAIALALVEAGRARKGEVVQLAYDGHRSKATVTDPVFYDPEGGRMRG